MKLVIFIVVIYNLAIVLSGPVEKCEEAMKCPEGQVYRLGPTWDCDDRICRGYLPYCENPEERVARCFCEDPLESMDGNRCVRICPPYP